MNETAETDSPPTTGRISPLTRALFVSAALIGGMFAVSIWTWSQLPPDSRVPIHWNAKGEVDGWAGRGALFLMPAGMIVIVGIIAIIPVFEPRRGHLLRSSKAYQAVWYGTLGFFFVLHGATVAAAFNQPVPMNALMGLSLGLLFILMGNYFGKIRSNYVMGIRTPWTLSSELSWNKTHRLGGRLFVILGIFMIIGGLLKPLQGALWIIMLVGIGILIGVSFIYSYLVWKNDPDKVKLGR